MPLHKGHKKIIIPSCIILIMLLILSLIPDWHIQCHTHDTLAILGIEVLLLEMLWVLKSINH